MTTIIQDKFDGAAGSIVSRSPDLGGAWGTITPYGYPLDLTGSGGVKTHDYVAPYSDSESGVMNGTLLPYADSWAELDFNATSTSGTYFDLYLKSQYAPPPGIGWGIDGNAFIAGRLTLSGSTSYYSFRDTGSGTNAVSSANLGSVTGAHTLRLEVIGTAAKLYLDGVLKLTATTTAGVAAAGYAGFLLRPWGTITVGEFRAGTVADWSPPLVSSYSSAASPLSAPSVLALYGQTLFARAEAASPLAAPQALAAVITAAWASAPGMLGVPAAVAQHSISARMAVSSMLGTAALVVRHDFTGQLGDSTSLYVMDLVAPEGTVRVPISSWQATLQTGSSNYVQCVIPACADWTDQINASTEFVIYRLALLASGLAIEYEMARAPSEQVVFNRGPLHQTCTLSGYSTAFASSVDPDAVFNRTLSGIRSVASGQGLRVRCAVDWLLRPGQRAYVDGVPFVVSYINYYAPSGFDSYMDVGE